MEREQGGEDSSNIIRATGGCGGASGASHQTMIISDCQLPEYGSFPSPTQVPSYTFCDPTHMMLCESLSMTSNGYDESSSASLAAHKVSGDGMSRPCNIFSRFLPISPTSMVAPVVMRGTRPVPILAGGDMMKMNSHPSCCPSDTTMPQIAPPRTPGTIRRKCQAKKVVCIPAPAATGSRPSGEAVPSDLWAWRKYGQKPIKGSPYPRGYYRCSSSKGCSARKQVERSQTDPSMLIITYTSEHSHAWPTQRNALAGSTRTQPEKMNVTSLSSNNLPQTQYSEAGGKEEHREMESISGSAKEKAIGKDKVFMGTSDDDHGYLHCSIHENYKAMFSESCGLDNLCLGEIDPDPMEMVFSRGLLEEEKENKTPDPFSMFK